MEKGCSLEEYRRQCAAAEEADRQKWKAKIEKEKRLEAIRKELHKINVLIRNKEAGTRGN